MRVPDLARRLLARASGLHRDRFFRRLAMLSGGVAAGQLFLALSTPLLTRLYTPDDFGVFAVVIAILAMFNSVSSMRLETSLPVCRPEALATGLATTLLLALGTVALLTLGIAVTVLLLPPTVGAEMRSALWTVPIAALFGALALPLTYLRVRRGDFRTYGLARMARLVSQGSAQIAFGLAGVTRLGLPLGYAVGPAVALVLLLRDTGREMRQAGRIRLSQILAYVREHWRYPVYMMPAAVLFEAVQFLPAVLLAAIFSPAAAGFFALSQRVLGLPVRFLSRSAGQVLLGEVAQASRQELSRRVRAIVRQFTLLGLAIVLPMVVIGSDGWEFLFGERWGRAWMFVVALSPMYLLRFVTETVSNMFIITNTQHLRFISSAALLAITLSSFLTAPYLGFGPLAATVIYSLGCSVVYVVQLLLILSLSEDYGKSPESPAEN